MALDTIHFDGDGELGHYLVVDCVYSGRRARVLYSGDRMAAQSGIALDGDGDLLFDYNQRFLELVRGLRPKRLLLIGGGAFTLPKALLHEFPRLYIDIVEPDARLLDIAHTYFGFKPSKRTRVYHDDGRSYLDDSEETYDLIVVDAYTDTDIPNGLQTLEAVRSAKQHLRPRGVMAMNIIAAYRGERSGVLRRIAAAAHAAFADSAIFPASTSVSLWTPQNFLCIGSDGTPDLQAHLRYAAVSEPVFSADDITTDEEL